MFGKKAVKFWNYPVRNCFGLVMTNTLVFIINSLKVPKIKKNITIWNEISYTKLQLPPEPLTRGLPPPDPHSLCPQLILLNLRWTKFLGTPLPHVSFPSCETLILFVLSVVSAVKSQQLSQHTCYSISLTGRSGFDSQKGWRFYSSTQCPSWTWVPPTLQSKGYWRLCL